MTEPLEPRPRLSLHLPASWAGGTFEGVLEPLHTDWHLEERALPERVAEMRDWTPLEDLEAGDAPEPWGALDLGGGGGPPVPVAVELVSGVVARVASGGSGLQLEELGDQWLNVSRYVEGAVLGGVGSGDVIVAECERGRNGRLYIKSLPFHQSYGEEPEA